MLANEFIPLPPPSWNVLAPDVPRWGLPASTFLRDGYRRTVCVTGPFTRSQPECRVTIDPQVLTVGIPVARLSGVHTRDDRTADFMRLRAEQWLR